MPLDALAQSLAPDGPLDLIAPVLLALAVLGCLYALAASRLVTSYAGRTPAPPLAGPAPRVTILKPLHGDEPGLAADLASFLDQDYGGPVQVVFGVQSLRDPARALALALQAAHPDRRIEVVGDARRHGANAKVSNLINMAPRATGEVIVLADSDMRVPRDWLARVVAELGRPGVGLVTALFHGSPRAGLWSRLSALGIDGGLLPNVVVGLATGRARPCFGSTIALRAETLAAIGGLPAFADRLADDNAMGEAVRALGLRVVLPPFSLAHACSEETAGELLRHELRWERTIRDLDPWGHAGSVVTHPFPLALLGALAAGGSPASLAVAGLALACRIGLVVRTGRAFGLGPRAWRLLPLRDVLSFGVFLASFFGMRVTWRGSHFAVGPEGTLVPRGAPPADALPDRPL